MAATALFKTQAGAEQYQAAYDATLALWPVPHQPLDVTTDFGTTHLNLAGAADLPPLILLHGFGVSSTIWYPNVAPLSRYFHIYALDVINQMGLGVPTRRLGSRQDCAAWLSEVLQALQLEQAAIVGHSYGGWLALNLALLAPQRVTRLVLLSPAAGIGPLAWGFLISFMSAVLMPTRAMIYRFMQSMTTAPVVNGQASVEQLLTAIHTFRMEHIPAPIVSKFSDAELRQISQPTQLLVGEQDHTCQPRAVLERARRLMPHIEAEQIAGGGHLFPVDRAEAANARMLAFLAPAAEGGQPMRF